MPLLTIVIGTCNRLDVLKQCLEALIGKIAVNYEIIVVDAGSTDGTLEYLRQLSGVRLICDGEPIGQAQSLNRVFHVMTSDYVCWISDDNIVQPGALDLATEILERHPDVGMIALKVKDVTGLYTYLSYAGALWPTGILTCNQGVLRTQLFKAVGGFDEAFRDYGIDVDLTAKVLLAGYKVVHTKMIAIHHHRDHQTAPGAIANDQRARRLTAAGELYRRKYAYLLPLPIADRFKWPFREAAWFAVQAARKLLDAETVLGYNMTDWSNVLHGRYIDDFDLWINRDKPFYLVQHIPDTLLRR